MIRSRASWSTQIFQESSRLAIYYNNYYSEGSSRLCSDACFVNCNAGSELDNVLDTGTSDVAGFTVCSELACNGAKFGIANVVVLRVWGPDDGTSLLFN